MHAATCFFGHRQMFLKWRKEIKSFRSECQKM